LDGTAEALPVTDSSVDAVWSVNTMHHWSDLDRALKESARVLRPGGRLLLVDEDFENPAHPNHEQFAKRHAKHGHEFTEVDPAAMAQTLRKLGFASAEGALGKLAGRPAKVIRAKR
jgi:ubiquinone/menaquinone biosynthesis C-methylase UbiE